MARARATNAVSAQVDLEVGDAHGLGQRRGTTARQRVQPSDEFAKGERLGEVVVGARIESLHAIVDRVARGEHQYGRAHTALAQRATEVEPTSAGEHDVENDDVVRAQHGARSSSRERRLAHDLKAVFGQPAVDDRGKLRIILYQENTHRARVGGWVQLTLTRLLEAKRLDGIQGRGSPRRPDTEHDTYTGGKDKCHDDGGRSEHGSPAKGVAQQTPPRRFRPRYRTRRRRGTGATASTRNWKRIFRFVAPSALRMPISRVRSVTDTSMMFMMPMPPTSRLTAAIPARRVVKTCVVSPVSGERSA